MKRDAPRYPGDRAIERFGAWKYPMRYELRAVTARAWGIGPANAFRQPLQVSVAGVNASQSTRYRRNSARRRLSIQRQIIVDVGAYVRSFMADIRDSFPSRYLKASDLHERDVKVTIAKVEYEQVGQDRQQKAVVYFRGTDKGLVLNKTNCNSIIQLTQSAETNDWIGFAITLYPTVTTFGGEEVECIRIRKKRAGSPLITPLPRAVPAAAPPLADDVPPLADDDERGGGPNDFTDDDIPF